MTHGALRVRITIVDVAALGAIGAAYGGVRGRRTSHGMARRIGATP